MEEITLKHRSLDCYCSPAKARSRHVKGDWQQNRIYLVLA